MEKSNASLQARKRKLKVLPYNKAKKSWRRTTNFSCSFKCRSVESKSINNHEYQRSLSSTYEIHSLRWYNTKRFCSHHEEKTRLCQQENSSWKYYKAKKCYQSWRRTFPAVSNIGLENLNLSIIMTIRYILTPPIGRAREFF